MNKEKLKNAVLLEEIISVSKQGLTDLISLRDNSQKDFKKRGSENKYHDGVYSLYVGEYSDMSGDSAKFKRYGGNMKLLEAMIKEIERQLVEFEKEFESM